ncbi:transmembrane protein 50A [Uranotaenia lowii]|uniref:transmembrane protein 50A n=1 Tax=Uranotaenia lowii TaxID=190385 RepID=UPI0024799C5B|nr:transmembrane protein 50A [Uranotaenia lowii]
MSIMDRISQSFWFDGVPRRNIVATLVASFLFFAGWWIAIDTAAVHPHSWDFSYYICGILATISFFMVNSISNDMLNVNAGYTGGVLGESGIKVFLFIGFVLGFASIIAAIWIMIAEFATNGDKIEKGPGYALLVHNIFIFFASLIYKFGRHGDDTYAAGIY